MTEQKIADYLLKLLKSGGGTVSKADAGEKLPFLDSKEIDRILTAHAPDVHEVIVAGIPCWRQFQLPENFEVHIKETIDKLEEMGFSTTLININLALSLRYGKNFQATYGLNDTALKKLINSDKPELLSNRNQPNSLTKERLRRPNTCFRNIDVRIGSVLVFFNNPSVTCRVVDHINKVKYNGETLSISTLAQEITGNKSCHGFRYFKYEGETLWDRRKRLEAEQEHSESHQ